MDCVYLATVCCVVSKQNSLLYLPTKWSVRCLSPANCGWVLTVILRMMRVPDLDSQWVTGRGQLCGHRHMNEKALMVTDSETVHLHGDNFCFHQQLCHRRMPALRPHLGFLALLCLHLPN